MSTEFETRLRARFAEIDREFLWTLFWMLWLVVFAVGPIFLAWRTGMFESPKATITVVITVAPEVAR